MSATKDQQQQQQKEGDGCKKDQPPAATTKIFRLEEVKDHKNSKSLWLIIDNKVYDVTKFMDEHPGGEEVLLDLGGMDATDPFEDVSHSSDAREMMEKYYIGDLHDDDKTKRTKPNVPTVEEPSTQSSWTNWLVPLGLALAATFLYRYVMATRQTAS
ncbi:cytochrome b5-like [Argonauta hians]